MRKKKNYNEKRKNTIPKKQETSRGWKEHKASKWQKRNLKFTPDGNPKGNSQKNKRPTSALVFPGAVVTNGKSSNAEKTPPFW